MSCPSPVQITDQDLQAALPDVRSTTHLAELEAPVTVSRDRYGIPHIKAACEHDLFFAQGFATAQDRLWQMDFDRHQALGRWSEFAGPSGLERDRLLRAAGMGRAARGDYEIASVQSKAMVDAYTAGVNAFISTSKTLPIEYKILACRPEPWQNWHCLAVYKMRNTLLGTFEPKLFRTRLAIAIGPQNTARIIRGTPHGHLLTVPPGAVFAGPQLNGIEALTTATSHTTWSDQINAGSNAWAISGARTESGLPLVAGDSHRSLDTPNVYYQVHLSCPEFCVIGHAIPGMPAVLHFCHNEYVAWGMTYGAADTQDLFVERFREGPNGRQYEFKHQWRAAAVHHETIEVRHGEPVPIEVTSTHHGPVIAGEPASGSAVTISDPGLIEPTRWLDATRDAMRSKSVNDLREALRNWTDRVNNYAVADVRGNFGYLHAGRIPIRPESNGWCAVPGWTGEYEWSGYIPYEELPNAVNPATGYVVTCNQRVAGHDYPYYVGHYFAPDYRARRVQARILELEPSSATVQDMAAIHGDRTSIPASIFTRALLEVTPLDEDCAQALTLLQDWDHRMDRDLAQPTIYARTREIVTHQIAARILGDLATLALGGTSGGDVHVRLIEVQMIEAIKRRDRSMLNDGEDWPEVLAEALRQAVADLKNQLGDDIANWQWGRIHRTNPQHPLSVLLPKLAHALNPPALPVHGDGDTPLAGSWAIGKAFGPTSASVNRYVHDPSDWTKSRWIVPLGASGHPASSHYADQAQHWSNLETIEQLWDWDQIASQSKTQQVLEPKP